MTECHDHGRFAVNHPGLDRGASVLADLLLPVTTATLGASLDIDGRAKASVVPVSIAFAVRLNMACSNVATAGAITGRETEARSVPA
ncbi:MAG: hypothetical protein OXI66_09830 [Boseongicola sp.]|nr:hypothetical protein [Boseongicola sp.]